VAAGLVLVGHTGYKRTRADLNDTGSAVRILVRAPNWLGDLVMGMPFLNALGREFPRAAVGVILKPQFSGLLDLLPFPVQQIPFDKRQFPGLTGIVRFGRRNPEAHRCDVYFCLPPSFSAAFMGRCLGARRRVGYRGDGRDFLLTHRAHRREGLHRHQEFLELLPLLTGRGPALAERPTGVRLRPVPETETGKDYIVLNPHSVASSRRLPLQQWVDLLDRFSGLDFVLIGARADRPLSRELLGRVSNRNRYRDLTGQTDIGQLARILAFSRGVISNDSGPAHLAAYVGARVAVFFGAGDPAVTAPVGPADRIRVLRQDLPCSPCVKNVCPLGTLACLTDLDLDHAHAEIRRLLSI
jgi:ADP-heptose:LPS heptosyltransferase